jgi:hypothetical protein
VTVLINPAVREMLGTLPPAEQDELLILLGRAAAQDAWRPGEEGRAP